MGNLILRPYQEQLVSNVIKSINQNHRNILVVASTGSGKTVTMVRLCEELLPVKNDEVVLILSHLSLLTDQTGEKFKRFSKLKTGVLQADVVPSWDSSVIIATMQSARDFSKIVHITSTLNKKVKALIVDESHKRFSRSYSEIFNYFPDIPIIDYTGSPFKNRRLATGFYDDVAFQISMQELINDKYLVPPVLKQIEFNQDTPEKRCAIILGTYQEMEKGKKAICFMRSKHECALLVDAFNRVGISARAVTSDTGKENRDDIFKNYDNGNIDILVSVDVLTAGFDSLKCEVVMMFGTQSPTSYLQRLGRALRPEDGHSVKPEHSKQTARIYVFGDTPTIQSGEIEKHHNIALNPKKRSECSNNEELLEWMDDHDLKDTPEYEHVKETCRVLKIAKKLNMPLISSMLTNKEIDPQFLGKIASSLSGINSADSQMATIKHKQDLILALMNNRDIHINDYSGMTLGEVKALYKAATGNDYKAFDDKYIIKTGIHAGKHVKDLPGAYKGVILKKAPNSDIAKIIRSFHKKTSQPK